MTWPDVFALLISSTTAIAVAYIGMRQALVKRELQRVNGHLDNELAALHESVRALHSAASARNVH